MLAKPRIALCMEYPVNQAGGVEALVGGLVRGLATAFELVLVSQDTTATLAESNLADWLAGHLSWQPARAQPYVGQELAAELKRRSVALAHFHFGGTYAWGSRSARHCPVRAVHAAGIPVLITNHGVQPPYTGYCGDQRPWWYRRAVFPWVWWNRLRVLRAATVEFTVSRTDQASARRRFWPLRGRIDHMYHSLLDEQEPVTQPGADARQPVVLAVGTIGARKGQAILVEAFSQIAVAHPDWKLRIVGRVAEEDYFAALRRLPAGRDLAGRIEWVGPLSPAAVAGEMGRAAIFAMPSLSEGLGLSLQEALFRGCAAVGSAVGGIPELIEDNRTGCLVPPGDPAALAKALEHLITDPPARLQLGQRARAAIVAKGMTRQQMVARHEQLYRALLGLGSP